MNVFVHLPVTDVHPGGDMGGTGRETVHLVDRGAGGQGAGGLGGGALVVGILAWDWGKGWNRRKIGGERGSLSGFSFRR